MSTDAMKLWEELKPQVHEFLKRATWKKMARPKDYPKETELYAGTLQEKTFFCTLSHHPSFDMGVVVFRATVVKLPPEDFDVALKIAKAACQ